MILQSNVSYEMLNFSWSAWCMHFKPCWQMLAHCLMVVSIVRSRFALPPDVPGQSLFQKLRKHGANWNTYPGLACTGTKLYIQRTRNLDIPFQDCGHRRDFRSVGVIERCPGNGSSKETLSLVTLAFGWCKEVLSQPHSGWFFSLDAVQEGKLVGHEDCK